MKTTILIMVITLAVACLAIIGIVEDEYGSDAARARLSALAAKLRGAVKSKTIWFNAAALVFIQQLPNLIDYLVQNAPALQPFIPANHYQFIIGAITIANLILRYKTTHPLEAK